MRVVARDMKPRRYSAEGEKQLLLALGRVAVSRIADDTRYFSMYKPVKLIPALVIGIPFPPLARKNVSHPFSFLFKPV